MILGRIRGVAFGPQWSTTIEPFLPRSASRVMARDHWQVVKRESGRTVEGSTATLSVGEAPEAVVRTAVRAANLIGDGLYGVDLKESGGQCYVMEVNDNPNVDAGHEDKILKDALYREVMGVFLRRIRDRKRANAA